MGSKITSESENMSSVEGMKIPSIELPNELFEKSLDPWRFSLIGRLNLHKIKFIDAAIILRNQWKLIRECKLIPLGRGFFTIKLDNATDRDYIKSQIWEVTDQVLKVRNWVYNFRPASQRTSKAFVWMRFPGLGLEFWSESILFKICKEIGTPIKIDAATTKCDVRYCANVLVEVDFAFPIPNKVWIGTKYGGFFQEVSIPDCPKYCSTCKMQPNSASANDKNETISLNKPFDICDRSECENEDSVIHTIHVTPTVQVAQTNNIGNTGRFSPLECVQENNILEDTEVHEEVQADVLETPQVKFIDGKTGKVSDETVKVTSWSKVVEKKVINPSPSTSQNSPGAVKGGNPAVANNKYNFRKNQGKGGTKNPPPPR
ncbi:uncharacterized protein LOC113272323 [Papaver somniferum]|uniref:uncharacterized protein LOC113272323 n=1 Tax=Papaver somniferum TaxID=3469 RepID=UPI000E7041F2|nr:uncharacterized protein LOC113272323 [Papaver somniferum]